MEATGSFDGNLTGLSPDTTYYYRAVAVGDGTSYGQEFQFTTTEEAPPLVSTGEAADVTQSSASLLGNLDGLGAAENVEVFLEWGTTSGSYNHKVAAGVLEATGPFDADIEGLSPGTTYYYRAVAVGDSVTLQGHYLYLGCRRQSGQPGRRSGSRDGILYLRLSEPTDRRLRSLHSEHRLR